jgi:hypothetical protein
VKIQHCTKCKYASAATKFERSLGSNEIDFDREKYYVWSLNSLKAPRLHKYESYHENELLFQRQSTLTRFNEYIYYLFHPLASEPALAHPRWDGSIWHTTIEFNLGTDPLGFEVTYENEYGPQEYGKTPVRDISLEDFKARYYSVVKWLYSLENDRYRVKKLDYVQYDRDRYRTPKIKANDMVLEHPWQKEFLFTTYKLVDTKTELDYDPMAVTIVPYTHAPIGFYEKVTEEYAVGYQPYHINIEDMAIRIETYEFLEQFDDGLE